MHPRTTENGERQERLTPGEGPMIKDAKILSEFNDEQILGEKLDYAAALRIFEGMWKEGLALGVLPPDDPLEGIEVDIRIAGRLNGVR
jgi:hypothetical protein